MDVPPVKVLEPLSVQVLVFALPSVRLPLIELLTVFPLVVPSNQTVPPSELLMEPTEIFAVLELNVEMPLLKLSLPMPTTSPGVPVTVNEPMALLHPAKLM